MALPEDTEHLEALLALAIFLLLLIAILFAFILWISVMILRALQQNELRQSVVIETLIENNPLIQRFYEQEEKEDGDG